MAIRWHALLLKLIVLLAAGVLSQSALAESTQQGPKLLGAYEIGAARQGWSVAVSADGNTAIVGGPNDNNNAGAVWTFTRSGGVWSPQGGKLIGTGAVGTAAQGASVALSADGTTAIVGGYSDNAGAGAAWVWTGSGGMWSGVSAKIIGTGAVGNAKQGFSVALSADGNTAIVGGYADNGFAGAAWVWTRSGAGVWSQQGGKLVGTGAVGKAGQGQSVGLSADGNTAIVGGPFDNSDAGAMWVFTRIDGAWTQQGSKLVGTGAGGPAIQGSSVALSADGNIAIVGGPFDNTVVGAAWVWTRSGAGVWSQQGNKLVGTGAVRGAYQASSVALSADGKMAIVGGYGDNETAGAAWIWTRSGGGVWSQQGAKLIGAGAVGQADQGYSVALSGDGTTAIVGGYADNEGVGATWVFTQPPAVIAAVAHDFDGDGKSDILWRHTNGSTLIWQMNANGMPTALNLGVVDTAWQIVGTTSLVAGTGDFDGDRKADILWRHSAGGIALWEMDGATIKVPLALGMIGSEWTIVGTGDFDGDGKVDILWRHSGGSLAIWEMNGGTVKASFGLGLVDNAWQVAGIGDIDGDGKADIVWRHTDGSLMIWQMNGGTSHTLLNLGVVATDWQIVGVGDVDGDGRADIVWRHTTGSLSIWKMNANGTHTALNLGVVDTAWQIVSIGDYDGDGKSDILWRHSGGSVSIWKMDANGTPTALNLGVVDTAWTIVE
jgi:hypothetical protein